MTRAVFLDDEPGGMRDGSVGGEGPGNCSEMAVTGERQFTEPPRGAGHELSGASLNNREK